MGEFVGSGLTGVYTLPAHLSPHPHAWSRDDVTTWLDWCHREYSLEIKADKFQMNGKALCMLTKADFRDRAPEAGDVLYNTLQTLLARVTTREPVQTWRNCPLLADDLRAWRWQPTALDYPITRWTALPSQPLALAYPQRHAPSSPPPSPDPLLSQTQGRIALQPRRSRDDLLSSPTASPTYFTSNSVSSGPELRRMDSVSPLGHHSNGRSPTSGQPAGSRDSGRDSYSSNSSTHSTNVGVISAQPPPAHRDHRAMSPVVKHYAQEVTRKSSAGVKLEPPELGGPPPQAHCHGAMTAAHIRQFPGYKLSPSRSPISTTLPSPIEEENSNQAHYIGESRHSGPADYMFFDEGDKVLTPEDHIQEGLPFPKGSRKLWEFLWNLLDKPSIHGDVIRWEDKQHGIFRILNTSGLARLWGQQKNKNNMTYEKMSRALRYYYRMDILTKVPGRRLTYRFAADPGSIADMKKWSKLNKVAVSHVIDTKTESDDADRAVRTADDAHLPR